MQYEPKVNKRLTDLKEKIKQNSIHQMKLSAGI